MNLVTKDKILDTDKNVSMTIRSRKKRSKRKTKPSAVNAINKANAATKATTTTTTKDTNMSDVTFSITADAQKRDLTPAGSYTAEVIDAVARRHKSGKQQLSLYLLLTDEEGAERKHWDNVFMPVPGTKEDGSIDESIKIPKTFGFVKAIWNAFDVSMTKDDSGTIDINPQDLKGMSCKAVLTHSTREWQGDTFTNVNIKYSAL